MNSYAVEQFDSFTGQAEPDLDDLEAKLGEPLPDEPVPLTEQLREVEALYSYTLTTLAAANAYLDVAENAMLPAKGTGTELDRKAAQTAAVAPFRAFRDRVDGLGKAINIRLMLGMALLKQHEADHRGLGRNVGA